MDENVWCVCFCFFNPLVNLVGSLASEDVSELDRLDPGELKMMIKKMYEEKAELQRQAQEREAELQRQHRVETIAKADLKEVLGVAPVPVAVPEPEPAPAE